eukprot:jgi/Psemu1/37529/gm1.37529_g
MRPTAPWYFSVDNAPAPLLDQLLDLFEAQGGIFVANTLGESRLRLVHGLRRHPGALAQASANEGKAFGYLDDIEGDAGELIQVNLDMLAKTPASWVFSLGHHIAELDAHWQPSYLIPMVPEGAAQAEVVSTHKAFFIPFELVPFLLGKGLTLRQAMGIIYPYLNHHGLVRTCTTLFETLRVAGTFPTNKVLYRNLPSLNMLPIPPVDLVLTVAVTALTDHQLKLSEGLDQRRSQSVAATWGPLYTKSLLLLCKPPKQNARFSLIDPQPLYVPHHTKSAPTATAGGWMPIATTSTTPKLPAAQGSSTLPGTTSLATETPTLHRTEPLVTTTAAGTPATHTAAPLLHTTRGSTTFQPRTTLVTSFPRINPTPLPPQMKSIPSLEYKHNYPSGMLDTSPRDRLDLHIDRAIKITTTEVAWGTSSKPFKGKETSNLVLLDQFGKEGTPAAMTKPPWDKARIAAAISRGPLGLVTQCGRRSRMISDYTFFGINEDTIPLAPEESMQFGQTLHRLLTQMHRANNRLGSVYVSKIDISDSFYCVQVKPKDTMKLGVLFPSTRKGDSPPPLIGILLLVKNTIKKRGNENDQGAKTRLKLRIKRTSTTQNP